MSPRVHVRRAAEIDVAEALDWYESQQAGLSVEFLDEFERIIDSVADNPRMFPHLYCGIRRAVLRRFPYLIWYRIEDSEVTVLACTHGKIDPEAIPERVS